MNRISLALRSMRPLQWSKNIILFAGLIFGEKLGHFPSCVKAFLGFLIFCALSGAVYLVNDIVDRDRDAIHPQKRNRPIASGQLPIGQAWTTILILLLGSGILSAFLHRRFFLAAFGYFAVMLLYSFWLKRITIVDAMTISSGFVIRAAAGAYAVDVGISGWLLSCTVVGSCFLAFCKRRAEIGMLEGDASKHRENLGEYSVPLLDQLITVCAGATAVCYLLYALSPETTEKFKSNLVFITFFPVLYALMRYMELAIVSTDVGRPEKVLLTD